MTKPFKPLLGEDAILDLIQWPMLMSPKLDGIRTLFPESAPMTRSLLAVPNQHINSILTDPALKGLDAEIIVGGATGEDVYNRTQSYVMSKKKVAEQEFTLHVFDDFTHPNDPFEARLARAHDRVASLIHRLPLSPVMHQEITSAEHMLAMHNEFLDMNFEGSMLRKKTGHYKFGRSTAKEGILLKWKPIATFEARILSAYEKMHNLNEATKDELGHTKRSSHKEGKVPAGTLGGFVVEDLKDGRVFNVGVFRGLKAGDLKKLWDERETLPGRKMKGESMGSGEKDLPRHPRWVGWFTQEDMALA